MMDCPEPYRDALAALARAVNDPRDSGGLVTANELQGMAHMDLKFFVGDIRQRCEWAEDPAQPGTIGLLIEALHAFSDRDPVAPRLLGFLSVELKLLRIPEPAPLVAWQVEFLTNAATAECWHGCDPATYFASKPPARSSLQSWVTSALVMRSIEVLAQSYGLSRTRNEASPPFSACDAVADHLQSCGWAWFNYEAIRKRYQAARKWSPANVPWWHQEKPAALVQGYLGEAALEAATMDLEKLPF